MEGWETKVGSHPGNPMILLSLSSLCSCVRFAILGSNTFIDSSGKGQIVLKLFKPCVCVQPCELASTLTVLWIFCYRAISGNHGLEGLRSEKLIESSAFAHICPSEKRICCMSGQVPNTHLWNSEVLAENECGTPLSVYIFVCVYASNFQHFSSHGTYKLITKILRHTPKYILCWRDEKSRYDFDSFTPGSYCYIGCGRFFYLTI